MNILDEKMLNEILEKILHKRRFYNILHLKNTIIDLLKENNCYEKRYTINITEKPESEYEEFPFPNEIDYMLLLSIEDNVTKDVFDTDLYFAKTRSGAMYITEFICQ